MSVLSPAISLASNALRRARIAVLSAANLAGVNRVIASSRWRTERLLILCYHGVSIDDEHEWSDLYVSPEKLERRLSILKREGASVLTLTEALERLDARDLPPSCVALTFDDGAHDFAKLAAPILVSADTPATVYLTTYYCGRQQPVFDTVTSYLLWKGRGRTIRVPDFDGWITIPLLSSDLRFNDIHHRLRMQARHRGLSTDEKDAYARRLAVAVGVDYDRILELRLFQIMSKCEVRSLNKNLIDVQLHTHRHWSPRNRSSFVAELDANSAVISELTGSDSPFEHFCYPSGDYVPQYRDWLYEYGVRWATTCDPGLAAPRDNPYALPRIVDAETVSEATFRAWVSGLGMFTYLRRKQPSDTVEQAIDLASRVASGSDVQAE